VLPLTKREKLLFGDTAAALLEKSERSLLFVAN
jgi:hypothetical protein